MDDPVKKFLRPDGTAITVNGRVVYNLRRNVTGSNLYELEGQCNGGRCTWTSVGCYLIDESSSLDLLVQPAASNLVQEGTGRVYVGVREDQKYPKPGAVIPVDSAGDIASMTTLPIDSAEEIAANPKTLMGKLKVPMLSVMSSASLIHEAHAMQYGAYLAPKKDGTFGYGPYNWRDQPIEAMVYIDAALRHIMQWVEGEECASDSSAHHLGHAKATLGILLDAIENKTVVDNRPKVRSMVATALFERLKRKS